MQQEQGVAEVAGAAERPAAIAAIAAVVSVRDFDAVVAAAAAAVPEPSPPRVSVPDRHSQLPRSDHGLAQRYWSLSFAHVREITVAP